MNWIQTNTAVFWHIAPCSLVDIIDQRFIGAYFLHNPGVQELRTQTIITC
jgi:hypothetical protein